MGRSAHWRIHTPLLWCLLPPQLPPHDVVALFSDLSAMLGSHRQLFLDTQQHVLKQQQAVQEFETLPDSTTVADLAAEVEALQAALQRSTANLMEIQQDSLLAGELSAVGGYWLLRRLLPQLQGNIEATLLGLTALPGLNYQVRCVCAHVCEHVVVCRRPLVLCEHVMSRKTE